MIDDTISRIEAKLRESGPSNAEHREELLLLLGQLKEELGRLERTHSEDVRNITGRAERSAEVATSTNNPELLKRSIQELADSVDGFENSHPQLVQIVNRIATMLSNLGI